MFGKFCEDFMKICDEYQKNFDAISETFWKRFTKTFVKYLEYRGNSKIDLRNVWWKFQENFGEFLDRLEGNLEKTIWRHFRRF